MTIINFSLFCKKLTIFSNLRCNTRLHKITSGRGLMSNYKWPALFIMSQSKLCLFLISFTGVASLSDGSRFTVCYSTGFYGSRNFINNWFLANSFVFLRKWLSQLNLLLSYVKFFVQRIKEVYFIYVYRHIWSGTWDICQRFHVKYNWSKLTK